MSTTATAKNRRNRAKKNYRVLSPAERPHYRKKPRKNAGKRAAAAIGRGWKG